MDAAMASENHTPPVVMNPSAWGEKREGDECRPARILLARTLHQGLGTNCSCSAPATYTPFPSSFAITSNRNVKHVYLPLLVRLLLILLGLLLLLGLALLRGLLRLHELTRRAYLDIVPFQALSGRESRWVEPVSLLHSMRLF